MVRPASVLAALSLAVAGCGGSDPEPRDERAARAAPRVSLSAEERAAWEPAAAPRRPGIPVLVYDGVASDDFARQMALLAHAGYETISLGDFARFLRREDVDLPDRPLLLTFADARLDTWAGSDATLRRHGFNGVLFVDVGAIEKRDREVLTWRELDRAQRSGRWEVQVEKGTGDREFRFGPEPEDVGSFYAYRGTEEVLGGWRERVFSDINYAEQQTAHNVDGYRPLAIAPPDGNYGQAGTNDRHIPRELLPRLLLSFPIVFTQDRGGIARPGDRNPIGRIEVTGGVSDAELRARLRERSASS